MKARTTGIITILDVIRTHPGLSKRQRDELLSGYDQFTKDLAKKSLAEMLHIYEMELTAESLITLHHEFGFGEKRLKQFARKFSRLMRKYADFLDGTETTGSGCLHDLQSLYPNCEEWFTDKVPCSDCEGQDICQAGFYEECEELTEYLK